MKNTYLLYKDANAEKKELVVATRKEWDEVLAANRKLPREQHRFFIKDCIADCGEMDCMYIEVSKSEYDKWHSKHTSSNQKRAYQKEFMTVSASEERSDESGYTLEDVLSDDFNLERTVLDEILISELRAALLRWNDWANDFLDYYLDGNSRNCSKEIIKKYGISYETVAKRKRQLNDFIKNFLK